MSYLACSLDRQHLDPGTFVVLSPNKRVLGCALLVSSSTFVGHLVERQLVLQFC